MAPPPARQKTLPVRQSVFRAYVPVLLVVALLGGLVVSLPTVLVWQAKEESRRSSLPDPFPVTVDPKNKIIVENELVNAYFESDQSTLEVSAGHTASTVREVVNRIALAIAAAPWYQSLAASDSRYVMITPGMRKEQVAAAFARALGWSENQKKEFLSPLPGAALPLSEGSFAPGLYALSIGTKPQAAQAQVNERFETDVLARYGTETAQIVPLHDALTIASLIEREARGAEDRRIISGIIWNRLFITMPLQIDASVQYAKANEAPGKAWWPAISPADMRRTSPYNTYRYKGLPPAPIASPSVASILAALNPKNTSCLFYFHDAAREFHCSDTYADHVALLRQHYGRGK